MSEQGVKPYDLEKEVLWSHVCSEERFFIDGIQKQIAFYTTLITAIFAATIAGIIEAEDSHHFLALMVGPVAIISISIIGMKGVSRYYQRFLEAIVMKSKLEADYGLLQEREDSVLWPDEGLINERHIDSRRDVKSSGQFVESMSKLGYQRIANLVFGTFSGMAILTGIGLIYGLFSP